MADFVGDRSRGTTRLNLKVFIPISHLTKYKTNHIHNPLTFIMTNNRQNQQSTADYSPLAIQDANTNNPHESEYELDYDEEPTDRQLGGAAVAGGLLGLILAGPFIALLTAAGAAVAATSKSKTGDVARSSGDAMASFGDRLKDMDQKHHVIERTSQNIASGADYIGRQINRERESATNATI